VIIGILLIGGLIMPNFVHSPGISKTNQIINNLRYLDAAAQEWAADHGQAGTTKVRQEDLVPYLVHYFGDSQVRSVAGERYILRTVSESPEAELTRKLEGYPKGTVFRLTTNGVEFILPKSLQPTRSGAGSSAIAGDASWFWAPEIVSRHRTSQNYEDMDCDSIHHRIIRG
jgi:hypothetical protein